MNRLGLVDTLVTHVNMRRGLAKLPQIGDHCGFIPPQLKTNKQLHSNLEWDQMMPATLSFPLPIFPDLSTALYPPPESPRRT